MVKRLKKWWAAEQRKYAEDILAEELSQLRYYRTEVIRLRQLDDGNRYWRKHLMDRLADVKAKNQQLKQKLKGKKK